MPKEENIRIRCDEGTKRDWAWFSSVYDTNEEALNALLDAHIDHADMTRRSNF